MATKTLQSDNGFTLIEAVIAVAVLSLGIASLYVMQFGSIRGNSRASNITTAATWNAGQIEQIVGLVYADPILDDDDSDGTDQDTNNDGVDDVGADSIFGLDDTAADGTFTTLDGRYTIFWNIAVDVPMENLKTIRIHVQDNQQGLSRPVTYTYIKADLI